MAVKRTITDPDNVPFKRLKFGSRKEWLAYRSSGLGGSDAACVLGLNPWKSSDELWEEKTGLATSEDISNKEAVRYGLQAERHLRELFALDYPEYEVYYQANTMLVSKASPWLRASLDGELIDKEGRRGVLEIKTTTINHSMQREKWNEKVPENYYCQILHALLVTGYEFAVLKAQLKSVWPDGDRFSTKHYWFEAKNERASMVHLYEAEQRFWGHVERNERPPLVLPAI